jgi:RNA polymerase sigma factor for flagellar operon FliA
MNSEARTPQELIENSQGLVISLASGIRRKIPFRVDLDDLIAYGEIGLAEAARDFDAEKGVAFTTFAYYRVRGAIYDGLSKMSWTSRARYRKMRFEQLANEHLANQALDPVSSDLESEAKWLRDTTEQLAIIFLSCQDDGKPGVRESALEDPRAPNASAIVAQREIFAKLRELMNALPNVEEKLLRMVYFEGATLQDAGNSLGISKSWASRLHAKALEHLARSLRRLDAQD